MLSADNATDHGPETTDPPASTTPSLTSAQRRVAVALAEVHQATASELNRLAGVSKSSTAKTLGMLEEKEAAIRTVREHDGFREADLWSPGPALGALVSGDTTASTSDRSASEQTELTVCPADEAVTETGSATDPSPALAPPVEPSGAAVAASFTPVPETPAPVTSAKRLAPGALATMVETVLRTHPEIEYTPTMISHMLEGRSAGAIHNVMEKLVASGTARRTCDKPKRYQHVAPSTPEEA